ncbi:MAG: response regulator [Melioribacteraceae bacterium]|nr:response regulator [Melioribacteraceae bacterium]
MAMKKDKHILIIDDEYFIRIAYQMILTDAGYNSTIVEDGEEAFEKILEFESKNIDIDLILTDINMPKINGFEFIKKLKEFNSKIPVILMSSYRYDEIEVLLGSKFSSKNNINNYAFIEKPSTSESLICCIDKQLNHLSLN